MPRKPSRKVSNCVQTSRKQDDEDGPSLVSVTSHSSASSQATLDVDQTDQVSIQEPLPSRPTRAAKVKCLKKLPEVVNIRSEGVEEFQVGIPKNVSKCRPNESVEQRQRRLERNRLYAKKAIANETVEQRELRREKAHQKYLKRKAKESVEEHKLRLERKRQNYASTFKDSETVEQRERRLERQRQNNSKRKATESVEERKRRIEKIREYQFKRMANESVEQREQRLERARRYDSKRRAHPNIEKRELRRKRQREYVSKCKAKNKIKNDVQFANLPKFVSKETVEQCQLTKVNKHQGTIKNIKTEPNSPENEQNLLNSLFASESTGEPLEETRLTRTSKSQCLLLISKIVSVESPPDVIINIRKGVPKNQTNITIEQDDQHLPKLEYYATQTVGEDVEKHELQEELAANETVEHATQDGLQLKGKEREKGKDLMTEDIHYQELVNIKTEPITQEYDKFCDVTASASIADPKPNVNGDEYTLYELVSTGGTVDNNIKTEDGVLLNDEYEVKRVLKMEIDIESEGVQQTTFIQKNSMADNKVPREKMPCRNY